MKRNVYVGVLLTALLMTSCINTKRIVYLEDMKESLSYPMNAQPEMKIQRDDRLSIVVSSRNPELTVPFNISTGGNFQVTSSGDVATGTDMQKCEKGYMVDLNGYIEFPVLGKLKVVDLSCKQVAELIKKRLIDENLINDPLVFIDILNIKITVMGEVESPQVLKIDDSRITLLEAITRTRRSDFQCSFGQGSGHSRRRERTQNVYA
ncbi:polysaccharide biosynthesis/export family protein [Bacteroides thetaiotaomicron]|uniref:polysaccharide biosynthesis/export family protein n=1 Tax=Bacteroides thetaiotaomicron TaxID=818 RepID=UPI0021651468|nr:polysaccharide biosynthesis/export family protein [Bacteroides thetaiotaomicron]MCS2518401.1 polysaccharide biosynthesis/export family protein [Bacteroides thetaiotaomicron]